MQCVFRILTAALVVGILADGVAATTSKYRWRKGPITVAVSNSLTSNVANIPVNADVNGVVERSLSAWQQAAAVMFRRTSSAEQNVSPAGDHGDGISLITIAATPENLTLFPLGLDDATARTRVFYDARGFITEADVVLNPYLQFSTDGTFGTFDLESTLTHELGHLLGLGHSPVLAATMSDNYGKNGVFNLPAFSARTLAADDVASVRSLYGPSDGDDNCCGRVNGRLILSSFRPAVNYTVWAEDVESGRVLAATSTSGDGSFRLGGLSIGKVTIYTQSADSDSALAGFTVGEFVVSAKTLAQVTKRLDKNATELHPDFLGFNGTLAGIAVPVNAGNSYSVLIGSTTGNDDDVAVGSTTELIAVQPKTYMGYFSNRIRTVGFDISVATNAPSGEYSLYLRSASGEKRFIIGGLTVEKFANFWTSTVAR